MQVLDEIAGIAVADGRFGAAGSGVTVASSAIDRTENVVFVLTDGAIDPYLQDGPYELSFQAVVRDPSYTAAAARAEKLMKLLTLRHHATSSFYVHQCYPRHWPIPTGRQEAGVYSFVLNFDAVWRTL